MRRDIQIVKAKLHDPVAVLRLGVEPRRIYLLTGTDGASLAEAGANERPVSVDGIELSALSVEDLLKNKPASGRDKEQGDVAWLKRALKTNV